jgi:hypothetical protein
MAFCSFLPSLPITASVSSVRGAVTKAALLFLILFGIGCASTEERPWNESKSWEHDNGILHHGTYYTR